MTRPVTRLLSLSVALTVLGCAASTGGMTRTYYVAADEVEWNYAPSGKNLVSGEPWNGIQRPIMEPSERGAGRVYRKAIYREYTDSTFATLKPRAPKWEHLGILGPLIRAEVGDTIRVVFKNNASFPASMHPHGVFYAKSSEGAPYADGTSAADKADDGVPTGGRHTYVWLVPERAGPTAHEGKSAFWMYHSHTNEVMDLNAGLVGPIIINARGASRADGSPTDTDREIVVAFLEVDENNSPFLAHNMATYAKLKTKLKVDTAFGTQTAGPLSEFNFRETLNGLSYGNTPGIRMFVGERVRWYLMATTNFEVHAPHWHGNTVRIHDMQTDVASLTTMEMVTADMVPDNPGTWLFHCHVANHLAMGMEGLYMVDPRYGT
jgi:FtsP/CotA-like multicopper oxidase with cupredoxin domain